MPPLEREVARFEPVNDSPSAPKRVAVRSQGLTLLRGDVVLAQAPMTARTLDALVSPDGRWVWHLGERPGDGSPLVTLFHGDTLEAIDSHRPLNMHEGEGYLAHWHDHTAVVSYQAPDMLVVQANSGDSFVLLLTLRATSLGIVDAAEGRIYETVARLLDEVIWHASFVGPDRLLVIDDIGFATLLAWPAGDIVSRVSISDAFSLGERYAVWPGEGADDDLVIGVDSFATDAHVLVSVCRVNAPDEVAAFAALDRHTLEVQGVIRSPTRCAAGLRQVGDDLFVVRTATGDLLMRLN
jgi:hypothetical protein